MGTAMLWATGRGEPIRMDGSDPTPHVRSQLPEAGGTCFLIVRFPPDAVLRHPGFDPVAADAEQRVTSPGIADLFEADSPGMHTTPSVDYGVVLDGEVWLELDDGSLTRLRQGDTVVQNGTRHAWRNLGDAPVTMAFVHVGARRPSEAEVADRACGDVAPDDDGRGRGGRRRVQDVDDPRCLLDQEVVDESP
jgi:hypothetical protein